jgi:hypothetical protein
MGLSIEALVSKVASRLLATQSATPTLLAAHAGGSDPTDALAFGLVP